jgi:hypothetical protein
MKKSLFILFILVGIIACKNNTKFHVSGTVKDAAGQTLYLEHNGLSKISVLDSVKLGENGEFSFKSIRPEYPDFYNLKLNSKVITFAVDSCEDIVFAANETNFSTNYTVKGSETSSQILQLRKSVMNIQMNSNELTDKLSAEERNAKIAEIEKDIEVHKVIARKLILQNPRSVAAYFAIYQKVNNSYLFSPYNKSDRPFCAAVATSFNAFMPDYDRTKNIYNLVMDAIHSDREAKSKEAMQKAIAQSNTGYIDIKLNDKTGKERKLSELEGKVVLIDFSAYESEKSIDYTFALRDLYNRYHKRGFEIYQVSLDRNKIIWEQSVENIPWICVRDEDVPNSVYAGTYNISSIPTNFLMTKKGLITSRSLPFSELAKQIEKDL